MGCGVAADRHRDGPRWQGRLFGLAGCVGVGVDQDDSRARDRDSGVLLGDGQGRIQRNEDESGARGRQQSDDEFGAAAGS